MPINKYTVLAPFYHRLDLSLLLTSNSVFTGILSFQLEVQNWPTYTCDYVMLWNFYHNLIYIHCCITTILCLKKTSPTFLTLTWKPIIGFW